jgi:hypothetical protein
LPRPIVRLLICLCIIAQRSDRFHSYAALPDILHSTILLWTGPDQFLPLASYFPAIIYVSHHNSWIIRRRSRSSLVRNIVSSVLPGAVPVLPRSCRNFRALMMLSLSSAQLATIILVAYTLATDTIGMHRLLVRSLLFCFVHTLTSI